MTTTSMPDSPTVAGPVVGSGRTPTFASLTIPIYRRLWTAGIFSFLAVQVQVIARGWLAYEITGSNTGLGGVYLGFGIPMLIATPLGGVAADRLSKRKVMLACQFVLLATAALVGIAVAFDFVEYWMLVASSAFQAAAFGFYGPSRMAMTADLVGRDNLANAVVLGQMSMNGTRVFGPALAGALIGVAFVGTAGVYFISATCTLAALLITLITIPEAQRRTVPHDRSPLADLKDGLLYVRRRPDLLLLVITSFVVVMVAFPYIAFLPSIASEVYRAGSGVYGILSGVSAVGAVVASLFIAGRASGEQAWRIQTVAGIGFGASVAMLAVFESLALGLIVMLLLGASASAFQSMNNSIALTATDLEYHGRVQSLMMLSFSGFGMAALPLGLLADLIGLRTTLALMGAVTLSAMAAYWLVRRRLPGREADIAFG